MRKQRRDEWIANSEEIDFEKEKVKVKREGEGEGEGEGDDEEKEEVVKHKHEPKKTDASTFLKEHFNDNSATTSNAYPDRKSTRLNSSHVCSSRMPSSA